MSWFSKDKKESDVSKLPEIPVSGNLMIGSKGGFTNNENMDYFPSLPAIPRKENRNFQQNDYNLDNFNDKSFQQPDKEINFARDMEGKGYQESPPVYNSISENDRSNFLPTNSVGDEDYIPKIRSIEDSQYPSEEYMNKVPQRIVPPPTYIANNKMQESRMRRSMHHETENERKKPFAKDTEPIYIRLDRFQTTIQSFEEIKSKINEIERLLNKTKEIRAKEERELEEWEQEIGVIKTKLDLIDKNIFEKVG